MLDPSSLVISGMQWSNGLLWLVCSDRSIVATCDPADGACVRRFSYPEVEHACPTREGVWLQTRGGKLGRQLILWSMQDNEPLRCFDCPDGAASGMTLIKGKLWLSHRRNRKLFCMDPSNGGILWTIRTDRQIFAPTEFGGQLWGIECDPGPLGDWSDENQAVYCFIRFDPVHERVVERHRVPFAPSCIALNHRKFWYAIQQQPGFSSSPTESLGRA